MNRISKYAWALLAFFGLVASTMPASAALTNLVAISGESVSFDATVLSTILGAAVVIAIGAGLVIAVGVYGGKFIWKVFKSLVGR
jgi:uncharacterized membrane protein